MVNGEMARLTYEPLGRASARTGLSVQELRRCIATGQLSAYRCGARIIRVDPREVEMLGESERNAADESGSHSRKGNALRIAAFWLHV